MSLLGDEISSLVISSKKGEITRGIERLRY